MVLLHLGPQTFDTTPSSLTLTSVLVWSIFVKHLHMPLVHYHAKLIKMIKSYNSLLILLLHYKGSSKKPNVVYNVNIKK